VRNTLRFLLSNLYDYDPDSNPALLEIDEWLVEQVDLLVADCADNYKSYDFGAVINSVHNFCAKELSRFYLDAIKDRMYCDGKDWETRRSGQAASLYTLLQLTRILAPILPHTCEEVYTRIPGLHKLFSIHAELFGVPFAARLEAIEDNKLQERFAELVEYRSVVFAAFEGWKTTAEIKDSQDAIVSITDTAAVIQALKSFGDDLPNLFKMSAVELAEGERSISFRASEYLKCERSRLRRPDVSLVDGIPLSARDRRVLGL
jgi:isoleucyl-tRNA synthetase